MNPNHYAVTLVASGTRAGDPTSWGGHAKVAIEYPDQGEHAVRYIHITKRDGAIQHHFEKSHFKNYSIKTNTVLVPKSVIKAALAAPKERLRYSSCGGLPFAAQNVTHNCYTYCVHFLGKLSIEIGSVAVAGRNIPSFSEAGINVPNMLIPLQELRYQGPSYPHIRISSVE